MRRAVSVSVSARGGSESVTDEETSGLRLLELVQNATNSVERKLHSVQNVTWWRASYTPVWMKRLIY